ncbi:unnamed protein product, partial [Symbiodinium sp. CCMP2592]
MTAGRWANVPVVAWALHVANASGQGRQGGDPLTCAVVLVASGFQPEVQGRTEARAK